MMVTMKEEILLEVTMVVAMDLVMEVVSYGSRRS